MINPLSFWLPPLHPPPLATDQQHPQQHKSLNTTERLSSQTHHIRRPTSSFHHDHRHPSLPLLTTSTLYGIDLRLDNSFITRVIKDSLVLSIVYPLDFSIDSPAKLAADG